MGNRIDSSNKYDVLRKRAAQSTRAQSQEQSEAVNRRFAALGRGGSGAAIKVERDIQNKASDNLQQANEGIGFQEAAEKERTAQIEAERGFMKGEREASQLFASGERQASQKYASGESALMRKYATGERLGSEKFQSSQAAAASKIAKSQFAEQMAFANKQYALDEKVTNANLAIQELEKFKKFGEDSYQKLLKQFQEITAAYNMNVPGGPNKIVRRDMYGVGYNNRGQRVDENEYKGR